MAKGAKGESKSKKKAKEDGPTVGHNLVELKKLLVPELNAIIGKFTDMESDMGSYRAELKDMYANAANKVGAKKKLIRELVAEIRAAQRKEAIEKERDGAESEDMDALRASLAGTPFGDYVGA